MAELAAEIEIPTGAVHQRTLAGLPLEATLLVGLSVALPWLAFHSLWALLTAVPVWGFLKFNSWKEPLFLKFWAGELSYKAYYNG